VAIASNNSNLYSPSKLQAYGWRVFCVEFLCGVVALVWYLLSLAERTALGGLTRLEKLAAPAEYSFHEYQLALALAKIIGQVISCGLCASFGGFLDSNGNRGE
jgi:hypothetical protein